MRIDHAPDSDERPVGPLGSLLRRGAVLSASGLMIVQIIAFVQTLVLARLLDPQAVGVFTAGTVLTSLLAVLTHGTLAQALIQRGRDVEDAAVTVFWASAAAGLGMGLLMLAAAPLLGRVFHNTQVAAVAAVMSGSMLLMSVTTVPDALMQRRFQFTRRVVVDPAVGLAYAVGAIVPAALGLGVWSMVIGSYLSLVVWIVASWWLAHWVPWHGRFSVGLWREMAVFSFPLLLDGVAGRLQEAVGLTLVGRELDESALGGYRFGRRIALLPGMAVVQIGSYVLLPAFSRIASDSRRLRDAFVRALTWIWLAAAPTAAVMAALGTPAVVLLLGEPWRSAGMAAAAMAGLGLGVAMTAVSSEALKGAGRSGRLNWMTGVGLLTGIPLLLVLLPFGLTGVGTAASVSAILVGVTGLVAAGPIVRVSGREMLRVLVPPLVAALVGVLVIVPVEHFVGHADQRSTLIGLFVITAESLGLLAVYLLSLRVIAPATAARIGDAARALRSGVGAGLMRGA
ncbi:Polysaccharide biosynthesis protein [Rhodococcus sp. RD6.2]|uniref:oligosaccharide flippase family protein n=1 Tax=Rhodococcus sp. RD6.2 TaxID=260936 RepID=UPI00063BB493|nr:oligosaccharide flippase family protein [Rhodococcus sp. RD6.2]CRK49514.1 Polysaccharide biosynthesis protein [Rhodococcus sp. RD6.2]